MPSKRLSWGFYECVCKKMLFTYGRVDLLNGEPLGSVAVLQLSILATL